MTSQRVKWDVCCVFGDDASRCLVNYFFYFLPPPLPAPASVFLLFLVLRVWLVSFFSLPARPAVCLFSALCSSVCVPGPRSQPRLPSRAPARCSSRGSRGLSVFLPVLIALVFASTSPPKLASYFVSFE